MADTNQPGWAVYIKAAGRGTVTEDQASALLDELAELHAGGVGFGPGAYTVTVNVEAPDPVAAGEAARAAVAGAAARVGLPDWPVVRLEAITEAEQDADIAAPLIPPLVGISEIAGILDVTRQRVDALRKRPDFPDPVAKLAAGPIWNRHAVERFDERWERRSGRPPKTHDDVAALIEQLEAPVRAQIERLLENMEAPTRANVEQLLEDLDHQAVDSLD